MSHHTLRSLHRHKRIPCLSIALIGVAACGGRSTTPKAAPTPAAAALALAPLAGEKVVVAPAATVAIAPELGWTLNASEVTATLHRLDEAIAGELAARGLRSRWIMVGDLEASYARNPTYAADPHALATNTLRSGTVTTGAKLTEPLASQLRTMVALHDGARLVLVPARLGVDPVAPGATAQRASLRLVLVDPRFSEVRWVGQVDVDADRRLDATTMAALARKLADLVVAP